MDDLQSLYFYLEDCDISEGNVKPIISATNKRLVDMPGYWEKMKNISDQVMAQAAAYWKMFKPRKESKFDGGSSYSIEDLGLDFDVYVTKFIDEDEKKIYYKLEGIPEPNLKLESVEEWIDHIEYVIYKGSHELFSINTLYSDKKISSNMTIEDIKRYSQSNTVILRVFFEKEYPESRMSVRDAMYVIAKKIVENNQNSVEDIAYAQQYIDDVQREEEDAFGRRLGAM